MKKRLVQILSITLSFCMLFASTISIYAFDTQQNLLFSETSTAFNSIKEMNQRYDLQIERIEILKDITEASDFLLLLFSGGGYAVVYRDNGEMVECLIDGQKPYEDVTGEKYYAGPFNYLEKADGQFYLLPDKKLIPSSEIKAKSIYLAEQKEDILNWAQQENVFSKSLPSSAKVSYTYYIQHQMPFGSNTDGTCGPVAAGMVLQCFEQYLVNGKKIIPSSIGYGEALHQSLIPYMQVGNFGSIPTTVALGINEWTDYQYGFNYIPEILIEAEASYALATNEARKSIADNRVCILFTSSLLGSDWGNHAIMAYGYFSDSSYNNYFNAHLGWGRSGSETNAFCAEKWVTGATCIDLI